MKNICHTHTLTLDHLGSKYYVITRHVRNSGQTFGVKNTFRNGTKFTPIIYIWNICTSKLGYKWLILGHEVCIEKYNNFKMYKYGGYKQGIWWNNHNQPRCWGMLLKLATRGVEMSPRIPPPPAPLQHGLLCPMLLNIQPYCPESRTTGLQIYAILRSPTKALNTARPQLKLRCQWHPAT